MVYTVYSADSGLYRHKHYIWVLAQRSIFPWPPRTPFDDRYDAAGPRSPAEVPDPEIKTSSNRNPLTKLFEMGFQRWRSWKYVGAGKRTGYDGRDLVAKEE